MRRSAFWIVLSALIAAPLALTRCTGRHRTAEGQAPGGAMPHPTGTGETEGPGMMGPGMMGRGMMGSATRADMQTYMEMLDHHREIRRRVEEIPGGIRTVTESDNPRLVALLQTHVASMYRHVAGGEEVVCMSSSLPIMFRNADRYRRRLTMTPKGVAVEETSHNRQFVRVIRDHAREVSGFVAEGMPAMMRQMMR